MWARKQQPFIGIGVRIAKLAENRPSRVDATRKRAGSVIFSYTLERIG